MAAAIPVIISFASAAFAGGSVAAGIAGVGALAAGSFGGFLTVGAGIMAGVGALSGNEKMSRIAGFMALGGGLAGAMSSAGAAAAEQGASTAWDAAGSAAGSDAAQLGKYGLDTTAATTTATPLPDATQVAQAGNITPESGESLYQRKMLEANQMPGDPSELTGGPLGTAQPLGMQPLQGAAAPTGPAGPVDPLSYGSTKISQLSQQGASMDSATLDGYLKSAWDKTGKVIDSVGKFTQNNPNLTKFGMDMIAGAYGPEAEAMDFRKSIYNRRMRNLNDPVKLGNRGAA